MSCMSVSPVFSRTNVPAASDHDSLKLVVSAEIQIWRTGVRADIRFSRFDSSFGRGTYRALSLSRNLGESMRFEVQAGRQNLISPFSKATGSRFLLTSVDTNLGAHYFFQGGLNLQRGGGVYDYNQWFFTLGYRFDSRNSHK